MSDLQAKARLPPHGDRSTDEPLSLRHAVAPAHFQKLVDLEVEILRIRNWLARQTQSSADAERLEQALNRLETAYYNRRHPPRTEAERLDHVLTEQGAPSPGTTGAQPKESVAASLARSQGRDPKKAEEAVRQLQQFESLEADLQRLYSELRVAGQISHLKVPVPLALVYRGGLTVALQETSEGFIGMIPYVGQVVSVVEGLAGYSVTLRSLTPEERLLRLGLALVPYVGRLLGGIAKIHHPANGRTPRRRCSVQGRCEPIRFSADSLVHASHDGEPVEGESGTHDGSSPHSGSAAERRENRSRSV